MSRAYRALARLAEQRADAAARLMADATKARDAIIAKQMVLAARIEEEGSAVSGPEDAAAFTAFLTGARRQQTTLDKALTAAEEQLADIQAKLREAYAEQKRFETLVASEAAKARRAASAVEAAELSEAALLSALRKDP